MQVFVGFSVRWFMRLALLVFFGVSIYYLSQGQNVYRFLLSEHPWITIFLDLVTCYSFLPPVVALKKPTIDGGEIYMRKTTWLLVLIIGILILGILYASNCYGFAEVVNSNILAPLSVGVAGLASGVFASPWWQTYFAPPLNAFLIGMTVMLVVSVVAIKWAWPAAKKVKVPALPKTGAGAYQSTPTPQPVIITQPQPVVQAPQPVATQPAPTLQTTEKVEETK